MPSSNALALLCKCVSDSWAKGRDRLKQSVAASLPFKASLELKGRPGTVPEPQLQRQDHKWVLPSPLQQEV